MAGIRGASVSVVLNKITSKNMWEEKERKKLGTFCSSLLGLSHREAAFPAGTNMMHAADFTVMIKKITWSQSELQMKTG